MVLNIAIVRHGKTKWNMERKYMGRTDKPLCKEGVAEIKGFVEQGKYSKAEFVFASPLLRCKETAELIYPNTLVQYIDHLKECSFGEFEGKDYNTLKENPKYIAWLDSKGQSNLHGGEPFTDFSKRCVGGFYEVTDIAQEKGFHNIAVVTHGGVIMHTMNHLTKGNNIFDWQVKNGCGYTFLFDTQTGKTEGVHAL